MVYVKKRREECVLFLDEGFSAESVAVRLRTAGFTVQRFPEWFRDENGQVRRNVEDPEVIRFCHRNGWMLVTRDHEMKNTHRGEIKKTEVAILATAHNSLEDQDEWVAALINLIESYPPRVQEARTSMVRNIQPNRKSNNRDNQVKRE